MIVLRSAVQWFAWHMEAKLARKDHLHPDGWRDTWLTTIVAHWRLEVQELEEALTEGDADHILDECVDVANTAMIIADIVCQAKERMINGHSDATTAIRHH